MILYTPKTTYAAHFHHIRADVRDKYVRPILVFPRVVVDELSKLPDHIRGRIDAATICTIHEGKCRLNTRPCETPNSLIGVSLKANMDSFQRAKGRKEAFARAVASLPREVRTALWRGYLLKTHVIGEAH